ncbi:MAG: glycosyltransferase family 4 protein [Verrucomicrobia bacterium]|nr:glycosyltransferase family 4 protein [Verrucomicrobiota bacterium]
MTHEYAPFRGGAATLVREIALALAGLGVCPEVWAPDYGGMPEDAGSPAAIRTVRWRNAGTLAPWDTARLAWSLARTMSERRPWRIALASVGALRAALILREIAADLFPGRVTVVFHGSEILKFQRQPCWRHALRRALAAGWQPACTTEAVAQRLQATGWIPPGVPIIRLPCALPAQLRAAAENSPTPRPGDPFRLLTLARLHQRKGQLETARALGRLPERVRRRVRWVLGGTGAPAYRDDVLATARAAGVMVEELGEVPDARLPEVYRAADAYVLASRELPDSLEGFGLTYLEAGAFGLPVIAARTGGVAEAVLEDETGLLVPEGDLAALAGAIERLLDDPALRDRLGAAGRTRALATSWRTAAENLLGARILC